LISGAKLNIIVIEGKKTGGIRMKKLPAKYQKAYDFGREVAQKNIDITELAYGMHGEDMMEMFDAYMTHHETATFFDLGYDGEELQYVTGWRYGEIPENGRSINFRDQKYEKGVSLMAIDGEEPTAAARLYEVFNSQGKRKIRVGGWLVGRGGDGEPLVILAEEIK
jgi:hypothetical protein